ncbi:MAG: hypothetical protein VKQ33_05960 [Candidatus Sericytochromatia bacterium]|nr:hypothetical protein [Candidatus Sericytochromatia bacterium]
MHTTRGQKSWLSLTLGLAVLAGCSLPSGTRPGEDTGKAAGRGNVAGGTAAATNGAGGPVAVEAADAGETHGQPLAAPALNDEGLAAVDTAAPMLIKASQGGKYVSEDGTLVAVIPPGALSQDTYVRFVRLDTSQEKNTNQFLAGMRFQMDLGEAHVVAGQKLMVSAKADDRLIPELKSMYEDYTPERYSLTQDDKGQWLVTMPVDGPRLERMDITKQPADPFLTERRGVMTEGMAPLPAGKGGNFKKDARIEAFCNYWPPPPPKPERLMAVNVKWESDDPTLDGKPAYDPNPAHNSYVKFGNTTTTQVSGVNGYWSKEFVAGTPAKPEVSHWEVVTSADASGMRTQKGTLVKYGSTDWTWALMQKYDDELLWQPPKPKASPSAEPDPDPADGGGAADPAAAYRLTQNGALLDALKADLQGKAFVALDSANDLVVKIIDEPAQPAVEDSWVDKWNAGWIDLSTGTNETVRRGYAWNGWCYCRWTVARDKIVRDTAAQPVGPDGKAYNYARETFTIGVQGFTNGPNPTPGKNPGAGIGSTARRTITAGYRVMQANNLEIFVPKYSPMFSVTLNSPDLAMTGDIEVQATLDGAPREFVFKANGANSMNLAWRIQLPDNNAHSFSLTDVRMRDLSLYATPASIDRVKNLNVQRNGIYDGFLLDLVPAAAK